MPILKDVIPLEDYKLILLFGEDEKRIYDFSQILNHKYYSQLREIALFKTAFVEDGEIQWATGQDFCPHTLYENSVILS